MFSYSATAVTTCGELPASVGVCADLLKYLVNLRAGTQPITQPCCSLIDGLVGLNADVKVCLCDALKITDVLGLGPLVNVNLALTLLLNECHYPVTPGYICY
ncbi:unnamed protein product [Linum tenue]|uniref:Hydrophobic seed protein domain-containing protein n=1 Tax=Linum tenue TaxID=586396 RepID=A0AAV0Q107_9ROSI|nr:unnamed protein product [Linum tenue]